MSKQRFFILMSLLMVITLFTWGIDQVRAQSTPSDGYHAGKYGKMRSITQAEREAAAARFKALREAAGALGTVTPLAVPPPGGTPDYFGPYSNYANSPLPMGDPVPELNIAITAAGSGAIEMGKWSPGNPFAGFSPIVGSSTNAPALAEFNGTLYIAVKGTADNSIYVRSRVNATWSPWTAIGGKTPKSPAMSAFNNRLYMAVKGNVNNYIYLRSMNASGIWDPAWTTTPGQTTEAPALAVFNNRLYLFVKGAANNNIYYKSMDTAGVWDGWSILSGETTKPLAIGAFNNRLYVFAQVQTTNEIHYRSMNTTGVWDSWLPLSGQTTESPSVAVLGNKLYVAVKGAANNNVYARSMNILGNWDPSWTMISANTNQSPAITPTVSGGMRKFVNGLPGLGPTNVNNLGQYLPVAVADTTTYPADVTNPGGYDYYEIAFVEYSEQMHSDLPATKLRGYVQLETAVVTGSHYPLPGGLFGVDKPHYLGPIIVAQRNRPVRVKFINLLPMGAGGNLFIPVDTTYMGAGTGPNLGTEQYTQNRAVVHLHGGTTPWISDGTLYQWTTPAGETTSYPKGVSVYNVPDMPGAGDYLTAPQGTLTFFYSNEQSARLMFYHDHAVGITRLNVYAGMAGGYLLTDSTEQGLFGPGGTFEALGEGIPLIIQDKTFVPDNTRPFTNLVGTFPSQLVAQDPTWDSANWGGFGQLWFPHVYMTNQNPGDVTGANAMGRWDYGPWFWPPFTALIYGPVANPYCLPTPGVNCSSTPWEPPFMPGTPNPSGVPESFMDTAVVNGTAYPTLTVDPKPYRFRILSVGNDRFFNLSLFQASSIVGGITVTNGGSGYTSAPGVTVTNAPGDTTGKGATAAATINPATGAVTAITLRTVGSGYTLPPMVTIAPPPAGGTQATATATVYTSPTEVGMVPFNATQDAITPFPAWWYTNIPGGFTFDDRFGGVPDPTKRGPAMIQIATEGGFLPAPVVVKNQPINYVYNRRDITVGNILEKALLLGPAERADVIVDFTKFAGKTLILYNDAPAPAPAADPRLDYFTGNLDLTDTGGAPSTLPGYGPNTRTLMQIVVTGSGGMAPPDDYNPATLTALQTALPTAFAASQDQIIVPQSAYDPVYGTTTTDTPGVNISTIQGTSLSFTPLGQVTPVLFDFYPKAIIEDFQMDYGRMNALLGVEIPKTNVTNQTSIIQSLMDPPTEVIKISDPSLTPIGTAADGTQLWKLTHNGVDTHAVHVHMFTVQIVNRVGWDGAMRLPDPNELGYKDTVRMNPLEDIILALRPIKLNTVPFKIPNSIRPLAPDAPIGATIGPTGAPLFTNVDPNGTPITPGITNQLVNLGWEHVWHCHLLGHEENDMMRATALAVAPEVPSGLGATGLAGPPRVDLSWTDNSANATGFTIQRAEDSGFTTNATTFTISVVTANPQAYTDTTVASGASYFYRVYASNTVGSTVAGYPQVTADSTWSNTESVTVP